MEGRRANFVSGDLNILVDDRSPRHTRETTFHHSERVSSGVVISVVRRSGSAGGERRQSVLKVKIRGRSVKSPDRAHRQGVFE